MNDQFFEQLRIPAPDINLEVGSGSHAAQTAEVMQRFERVLEREAPDAVVVVGDVNSTLACSLVAAKKGIKVAHVEAGLRSRDRGMPEEVNRVVTDRLADRLYTTEREASDNLRAEGIAPERVVFVGNVMIDALQGNLERAVPAAQLFEALLPNASLAGEYAVLTLHRPSNVDDPRVLGDLLATLHELGRHLPIIFPMHPRTSAKIAEANLEHLLDHERLLPLPPLGYLEMLGLTRSAKFVLTDSGGLQEETTALGVPCLTLRDTTERPVTVEQGTNLVVGTSPERIRQQVLKILRTGGKRGRLPEYWDGQAAQRIAQDLHQWLM